MFSTAEKLACVERELHYRIKVYSRLIAKRKMSERQASREIAIMGAIVDDYRGTIDREEPEFDMSPKDNL